MISKGAVRVQKKNLWQDALYWVLLLALLTAGGFLLFTNLGETGISDCDEARHGINAYEMMQSGDYVVTTYRGEPDYWNLKPPLTDYCIMLGYRLFGYNALGLRFYSALSMMLTMIVLALWTRRRYGRIASLCTQLMLLGCGLIYGPHFARFGDADAQMLLFYVVAMICMLESHRRLRLLYGTALCFGLDVFNLQRHVLGIAVRALAAPFLQQVLAQLVAEQGALLVLHSRDFRVLQGLHIKAHQLAAERANRRPTLDAPHPGHAGIDPVLQRGRQPARLFVAAIKKTRGAVAQLASAAAAHMAARG